jgi:competence protein ComEC
LIQLRTFLPQLTSFWIFPALLSAAAVGAFLTPSFFSISILLFFCIRIICTKNRVIILASCLCSFILLVACLRVFVKERQDLPQTDRAVNGSFYVLPDKIKVSGDQLQLEGNYQVGTYQQKTRAFYTLTSEKEQQWWQRQTEPVTLKFSGTFALPKGRTNKNSFDYAFFLRQQGIQQTLSLESISQVKGNSAIGFHGFHNLRKKALLHSEKCFDARTAMYMNALLWGEKTADFASVEDLFASLGILHLFSLSGMHVAFFIGGFRYLMLKWFKLTEESTFWWQLLFSLFYANLTGFSVSVIRALLQKNLAAGSQYFQWQLRTLDCWSITLLIHMVCQPWLLFSIGGQFSYFLSFIILFLNNFTKKISTKVVKEICFSMILSIASLPIIVQSFHEWVPLGSIVTFLLMPIFETVILPVLTAGFFISLLIPSKIVTSGLAMLFYLLEQCLFVVEKLTHFKIVTGHVNHWLQLLSFLCVCLLIIYAEQKSKMIFWPIAGLILLINSKYLLPFGTVALIDVGQGDSIFIQAPFHQENILIDTGGQLAFQKEEWQQRTDQKSGAAYSVIPYLKSQGVKTIDTLIITHGHEDHFGDLATVGNYFKVKHLYFPKGAETNQELAKVMLTLKKAGTICSPILAPVTIKGAVPLKIVSPQQAGTGDNDDSIVVHLQAGRKSFLLTGDLEAPGEQKLLQHYPTMNADILKVGHHGSKTSSSKAFIEQIAPEAALISCGVKNRFKHPHQETLATLTHFQATIYRTDLQGMVYYQWTPFTSLSDARTLRNNETPLAETGKPKKK